MRQIRVSRVLLGLTCAGILGIACGAPVAAEAPHPFAVFAFQQLWAKTDAIPDGQPYVWGPGPFTDGIQEPYDGGTRIVQYFDKGRMEQSSDMVTAGLLAVELITGREQDGDTAFQQHNRAALPVAGEPDNRFPTYADLAKVQVPEPDTTASSAPVAKAYQSDGSFTTDDTRGDPQVATTAYDAQTRHTLPRAFALFRANARNGGLAAIGLAITEPVWVQGKLNGQLRNVLAQAFERRVLTYTPSNPAGFRVEYGNIGRAYAQWRYPNGVPSPGIPEPHGTNCGTVQLRGPALVSGQDARPAEECVRQAYQQCATIGKAAVTVTQMGVDTIATRVFTLAGMGGSCAIREVVELRVVPRPPTNTTYTCTGLTRDPDGTLHFTACGADGDVMVPAPAMTAGTRTVTLAVGDAFLLNLGDGVGWRVAIADPSVVSRVVNITVIEGAQGVYKANGSGQTTLTAVNDPPCQAAQPPCAAPSRQFQIQIVAT